MITPEYKRPTHNLENINNVLQLFNLLLIELFKDQPSLESIENYVRLILLVKKEVLVETINNLINMITSDNLVEKKGIDLEEVRFQQINKKASMILLQIFYSAIDSTHQYDPSYPTNRASRSIPIDELFLELKIIIGLHGPLTTILGVKIIDEGLRFLSSKLKSLKGVLDEQCENASELDKINLKEQHKKAVNSEIAIFKEQVASAQILLENRLSKLREYIFEGLRNHLIVLPELFSLNYEGYDLRNAFNQAIFRNHFITTETANAFLKIHLTSLDDLADKMLDFLNSREKIFGTHSESDLKFIENLSNMILDILDIIGRTDIIISRGEVVERYHAVNPDNIQLLMAGFNYHHQISDLNGLNNLNATVTFDLSQKQIENAELVKRIEDKINSIKTMLSEKRGKLK